MFKQLIIARRDLNMSPGKLAAQVSHNWIAEAETKVVCRAKNKNDLLKAVKIAEELGWEENKDYWLIYDACRTELEREGPKGTLTCIGFRPMEAEEIDKIGKKYQLYN